MDRIQVMHHIQQIIDDIMPIEKLDDIVPIILTNDSIVFNKLLILAYSKKNDLHRCKYLADIYNSIKIDKSIDMTSSLLRHEKEIFDKIFDLQTKHYTCNLIENFFKLTLLDVRSDSTYGAEHYYCKHGYIINCIGLQPSYLKVDLPSVNIDYPIMYWDNTKSKRNAKILCKYFLSGVTIIDYLFVHAVNYYSFKKFWYCKLITIYDKQIMCLEKMLEYFADIFDEAIYNHIAKNYLSVNVTDIDLIPSEYISENEKLNFLDNIKVASW
jgi:hypothetical protein